MPSTFEPNLESEFLLRLYAEKPPKARYANNTLLASIVSIHKLDTPNSNLLHFRPNAARRTRSRTCTKPSSRRRSPRRPPTRAYASFSPRAAVQYFIRCDRSIVIRFRCGVMKPSQSSVLTLNTFSFLFISCHFNNCVHFTSHLISCHASCASIRPRRLLRVRSRRLRALTWKSTRSSSAPS